MVDYKALLEKFDQKLHEPGWYTQYLEKIEKATGVKRLHFALGLSVIWGLYMILGHFAQLICNLIGFVWPAYQSMIAIESHIKDDDTKWLTYWVVFATFSVGEFFSDILWSYIPFYWLAKCIFLLWCCLPTSNSGSHVIYNRVLRPIFLKNYKSINDALNKVASGAAGLAAETSSKLISGKTE